MIKIDQYNAIRGLLFGHGAEEFTPTQEWSVACGEQIEDLLLKRGVVGMQPEGALRQAMGWCMRIGYARYATGIDTSYRDRRVIVGNMLRAVAPDNCLATLGLAQQLADEAIHRGVNWAHNEAVPKQQIES